MSLVSSAHNPCYQLRPQPIHYQSLAGECIGPQKLPATPTWGENLVIFPCSVSNFRAGGLWFIISLRRDWLIGAGALWVKAGELLCYWGRNKSIQSRLQDIHWLQHRLWRPVGWVYYKYRRFFFCFFFFLNIRNVTLQFIVTSEVKQSFSVRNAVLNNSNIGAHKRDLCFELFPMCVDVYSCCVLTCIRFTSIALLSLKQFIVGLLPRKSAGLTLGTGCV